MQQVDVQPLRNLGLSDEQILSTVLITCLFNFMTRLADGLRRGGTGRQTKEHRSLVVWPGPPARVADEGQAIGPSKVGYPSVKRLTNGQPFSPYS